jgi:hypothetical protein
MTSISNPRSLCLTSILWRQELLTADPSNPSEDIRTLSLHAKAGWPQNWFHDRSLFDILFEIEFRSDHGSKWKEKQPPELQGAIGVFRYCKSWQDSLTEESIDPCVGGYPSVSDKVFDELWERVKLRVALPCDIWIDVVGMTVDPSPAGDDYWDVNSQPKLTVVRVKFRESLIYSFRAL